jgi:hypothetical protein
MKLGGTDREVAQALGVTESTLNLWKLRHPKFSESIKVGKSPADNRTEVSLFRKTTGYSYDSEEIFMVDEVIETPAPKKWKNRQSLEHSTPPGRPMQHTYGGTVPELLGDYYAKIAQAAAAAPADPATDRAVGSDRSGWEEPGDGEDLSPR